MHYSTLAKTLLSLTQAIAPCKVVPLSKLLNYCAESDEQGGAMFLDPTIESFCKVKKVERRQQSAAACCENKYLSNLIANRKIVFSTEDEDLEAKLNETLAALDKICDECTEKPFNYEFSDNKYVT